MALLDGGSQSCEQRRILTRVFGKVRHGEGDVARLVLGRELHDALRAAVGCVRAQESQQIDERAFAENSKQQRRAREIGLFDQSLQRGPPAYGREPELAAEQARAPRENFDVSRFVRGLHCEQLHALAEMGVCLTGEPCGHEQRSAAVSFSIR